MGHGHLRSLTFQSRISYSLTFTCHFSFFFDSLLYEKRKELGDAANKLKNGLYKIDDTRAKVEVMSVELEEAKTKVAQFQKQCEEYLVIIVQQKREADEQQKVRETSKHFRDCK